MKFVDQVTIDVAAGSGGDGCLSFHRARHLPKGGPDGGDGGSGGDVYLLAEQMLHTLADFRYQSFHEAEPGDRGGGNNQTGKSGVDLSIKVPVGTRISHDELRVGDLVRHGQRLLVAKGGSNGLGNVRFKASTNRAPRRTTKGGAGEQLRLQLDLLLMADVGLLGMPNAGKSTLITRLSAAKPKIANYPFTTLRPFLGVVRFGVGEHLVMADIPGLVAGAGKGVGLGHQFLRHISRARLLLHLIDLVPQDGVSVTDNIRTIEKELSTFDDNLMAKQRWLVFTKSDLLPTDEALLRVCECLRHLQWSGPHFIISAHHQTGLDQLLAALRKAQAYIGTPTAQAMNDEYDDECVQSGNSNER